VSRLHGAVGKGEGPRSVLVHHRFDDVEEQVAPDEAEHRRDVLGRNRVAGEGDHLVERALRVAHAALAGARHEADRRLGDLEAFRGGNRAQLLRNRARRDGAELEDLRTRQDGVGNLVELGRGHEEHDVRWRLLDRLQQRVERGGGELVHLVDDEDLVAVPHRRDGQPGDDHFPDVVDAGVARRVDLEHVDVAALGDLGAGVALTTGIGGGPFHAVQRPRQDARRGRLAAPAGAGEHEGVRHAAAADGIPQRARHRLLPDDVVEALRPPFAREYLVGHLP
jgi:hypothetical protein